MNNPHCKWHIYKYNGKRYLTSWGENQTKPYEIKENKKLAETEESFCDISDGELEEVIECDECPCAKYCSWEDLPEEYAVDNGWELPEELKG